MKTRIGTRGAALVEYVILLVLIGVVAIGSVSTLGGKVKGTFGLVADSLSSAQEGASEAAPDGGEEVADGPTFTWKGDGTDVLPAGVTTTSDGWLIDIDSLVDRSLYAERLRFSAMISQVGSVAKKDPDLPDSTSSYTMYAWAYWVRDGQAEVSLVSGMDSKTPSGDLLASSTQPGAYVPDNVTGIRLKRSFYCSSSALCDQGTFIFDIDFYTSP